MPRGPRDAHILEGPLRCVVRGCRAVPAELLSILSSPVSSFKHRPCQLAEWTLVFGRLVISPHLSLPRGEFLVRYAYHATAPFPSAPSFCVETQACPSRSYSSETACLSGSQLSPFLSAVCETDAWIRSVPSASARRGTVFSSKSPEDVLGKFCSLPTAERVRLSVVGSMTASKLLLASCVVAAAIGCLTVTTAQAPVQAPVQAPGAAPASATGIIAAQVDFPD